MRSQFGKIAIGCVLAVAGMPSAAYPQAPAPAAPNGSVVVASPTYTSIAMEITVNRSAAEVWKRIGKYCDISEWLQIPAGCKITSGTDGEFGAVRTVGAEVLVGRTELSYTYAQTPKEGTPYNLYHGTFEARPVTPTTSKIVYTLFFDNSMLPDDAARAADKVKTAHQVHAGAAEHENARRGRQVELRWRCVRAPRWKSQPPAGAACRHRSSPAAPCGAVGGADSRVGPCPDVRLVASALAIYCDDWMNRDIDLTERLRQRNRHCRVQFSHQ